MPISSLPASRDLTDERRLTKQLLERFGNLPALSGAVDLEKTINQVA
jgi:hypothetical protein